MKKILSAIAALTIPLAILPVTGGGLSVLLWALLTLGGGMGMVFWATSKKR